MRQESIYSPSIAHHKTKKRWSVGRSSALLALLFRQIHCQAFHIFWIGCLSVQGKACSTVDVNYRSEMHFHYKEAEKEGPRTFTKLYWTLAPKESNRTTLGKTMFLYLGTCSGACSSQSA